MIKALLAERFKVRLRSDLAVRPVYALTLARDSGRLGPNLRPSRHDCASFVASQGDLLSIEAPRDEKGRLVCTGRELGGPVTMVAFGGASMVEVAARLAPFVDRQVIDKTGLSGTFDVELFFASDSKLDALGRYDPSIPSSIFNAVQEQLGLKLESQTGPAEILVIESVERPTPD